MTELETIARAQMYMEKLANGINPLTGKEVAENDVVNNVRISRCMFYVSNLLKEIVDNKGKYKAEMSDRVPFTITPEQIQNLIIKFLIPVQRKNLQRDISQMQF